MEGQPRVEELLNKIIFLRKALEFYAEQKNYNDRNSREINSFSTMEKDQGYQARFALEQSEDIKKYNENLIEEYRKAVEEGKEQEKGEQEALDMIVQVNKLMLNLGNKNK